ncbi:MAG: gas vesicle protein GvpJ, partial [Cyanobacteriota bacterium]
VLTESNQQLLEQVKFLQEEVKALKALLPQENQPKEME